MPLEVILELVSPVEKCSRHRQNCNPVTLESNPQYRPPHEVAAMSSFQEVHLALLVHLVAVQGPICWSWGTSKSLQVEGSAENDLERK